MREGFVLSGGAQLYYQIHGEGAPVLLLHGNGEDLHCFDQQIGVLAKRCQAVLLESRGHGRSTHGDGVVSIRQIALDAQAVIDALGLQAPVVVGFSDGANAAIQLALDCPQKLGGLVLAGANLEPAGVRASVQAPITIGYGVCRFLGCFPKKPAKKARF